MTLKKALSMAHRSTWATYDRVTVDAAVAVLADEVRRLSAIVSGLADSPTLIKTLAENDAQYAALPKWQQTASKSDSPASCEWRQRIDGSWNTGCGHKETFRGHYNFCGDCGLPLVEVPYVEREDGNE